MWRTLIRHDLKVLAADRTLVAVVALLTLVIAFAAWNGVAFWQQRSTATTELLEEAEAALAADRQAVRQLAGAAPTADARDPATPLRRDDPAVLPPAPLAALAVGIGDLAPYWSTVGIYTLPSQPFTNTEIDNPLNLLAGNFDLAFALVFLFPLIVLALSYDLISGERQRGTLALALVQPVPLRRLLLAKLAARAGVVLALAIVLSVLALFVSGAELGAPGALSRLFLWIGVVAAYGLFWFAAAVLVNALGRRSSWNALVLAALWLAICVVVPALLQLAAERTFPVPSRLELVSQQRRQENQASQRATELLKDFYGDHPELAPPGEVDASQFAARYYTVRLELDERLAPLVHEHERQLARQQGLVRRLGYLSPAVLAHETVLDLAGSGLARQTRFREQVRDHIERWRAFFVPKVFRDTRLTVEDFDAWPRFVFAEESGGEVARRVVGPLAGVLVPAFLVGLMGVARLRRYQIVGR